MQHQPLREGGPNKTVYSTCSGIRIPDGILVDTVNLDKLVTYGNDIIWQSFCVRNGPAYLVAKTNLSPYPYLPVIINEWHHLIVSDSFVQGYWRFGLFSILLSYSTIFVITLFLTVIVFLDVRSKPYRFGSTLLKLSAILASVNMSYFIGASMVRIEKIESRQGHASVDVLIQLATTDTTVATLNIISVFTAKMCQVDIVSRLFQRVQEQRMIMAIGVFLVCVSLVLTCISTYTTLAEINNISLAIMTPFVLLFDVTLATCFACLIIAHICTSYRLFYKNIQMLILTILTFISVLLSPAFFLADIGNKWLSNFSTIINPTLYTCAIVLVWTWLDRISHLKNILQSSSILGKPIYEEEQANYNFAYYLGPQIHENSLDTDEPESIMLNDMFSNSPTPMPWRSDRSEDSSSNKPVNSTTGISFPTSNNQVHFQTRTTISDRMFNILTDGTNTVKQKYRKSSLKDKSMNKKKDTYSEEHSIDKVRKRLGLNDTRQEYIYKTKDIIFESDEENGHCTDHDDISDGNNNNIDDDDVEGHIYTYSNDSQHEIESENESATTEILSMNSSI
ncbi:Rim21p [Nakaseomyces bracarensis]|uniref:Rim21p n=1 Tax=Nakaseomyces bracarensis TaxID=273131 RepID=UPI0038729E3A